MNFMGPKWKVVYYTDTNDDCPVEKFISSRSISNQAKILNWVEQLEIHGPNLPRPYADLLDDGIHELRIKLSGDHVRILYFFCYKEYIILTHVFTKTSDKVPHVELEKSKRYRDDFIRRFNDKSLKGK